ncbi:TB2/DP1, HVA22 family-domain-containing protein [Xylariomycetidae sp. FL2044]|nr:TB2/DP1, HVA22 family-domain-containing protein [Xylariomycetidae sp. FL2044]
MTSDIMFIFDIIPNSIASLASFLFPLFASYKAIKTSDPAQLTAWLMYWCVLSVGLLAESWLYFILCWIPFYAWMRAAFLVWLVLPSTQGGRHLYEAYLHPYLEQNEQAIEEFIASAHDRVKAAGLAYLKQAIELLRTRVLGLPPSQPQEDTRATAAPQGYTQALLARFNVPAARWAANSTGSAGHDFYNILAGAVGAMTSATSTTARNGNDDDDNQPAPPGSYVPANLGSAQEKMSFIAAQRDKLAAVMGALDKEAAQLEENEEKRKFAEQARKDLRAASMSLDGHDSGGSPLSRPPSGHSVWSGLSKSRSEVDFEKIDAESGAEENDGEGFDETGMRRRMGGGGGSSEQQPPQQQQQQQARAGWSFLGWGVTTPGGSPAQPQTPKGDEETSGQSSGFRK